MPLAAYTDVAGTVVGNAVVKKGNCVFITWAPGPGRRINIERHLDRPGSGRPFAGQSPNSQQYKSASPNTKTSKQSWITWTKRTEETITTAKQAEIAVPFKVIQANYDSALEHENSFKMLITIGASTRLTSSANGASGFFHGLCSSDAGSTSGSAFCLVRLRHYPHRP